MTTAGAFTLRITDVAFIPPPPNRPPRPDRRHRGHGVVTTLLRTIRRRYGSRKEAGR